MKGEKSQPKTNRSAPYSRPKAAEPGSSKTIPESDKTLDKPSNEDDEFEYDGFLDDVELPPSNATYASPPEYTMPWGQYSGKTFSEIEALDSNYLTFLSNFLISDENSSKHQGMLEAILKHRAKVTTSSIPQALLSMFATKAGAAIPYDSFTDDWTGDRVWISSWDCFKHFRVRASELEANFQVASGRDICGEEISKKGKPRYWLRDVWFYVRRMGGERAANEGLDSFEGSRREREEGIMGAMGLG